MVGGAAAALLFPETVIWMKPGLEPAFAITMFFVGTLVRKEEVAVFRLSPFRPLAGVLGQYTIMPMLAFGISLFFDDPAVRSGIVLVGCMPGAMASNVMTVLVKGDLVFSVIMTTLATLICPLVLAFWLPILADTRMDLPVLRIVADTLWMVVIPVVLGAAIRLRAEGMPRRWQRVATAIASVSIVLIILVVVAVNRDRLLSLGPALLLAMVGLNLSAYAVAHVVARILGWHPRQRRTFVIEVGMQNAGLGSVLALAHLGPAGAVPSAFYTALCVLTAAAFLPVQRILSAAAANRAKR